MERRLIEGGPPVTPERMMSMMAAYVRGVRLRQAIEDGLVRTTVDRETWDVLAAEIDEIHASGKQVELGSID